MYKTILVPIDLTEDELTSKAVRHAVNLAKQSGANIHLIHVLHHTHKTKNKSYF